MNSVLQTLATIPELESTIKKNVKDNDVNNNDISISTVSALKGIINQLKASKAAINPIAFLLTLHKNFPQFAERREGFLMQQDAEECWTQIVHCLKKVEKAMNEAAGLNAGLRVLRSQSQQPYEEPLITEERERLSEMREREKRMERKEKNEAELMKEEDIRESEKRMESKENNEAELIKEQDIRETLQGDDVDLASYDSFPASDPPSTEMTS